MRTGDAQPERPRIFCIGLNKTGTSSFHEAMTILGFESLHFGGSDVHNRVLAAIEAGAPLLSNLDPRFDAFSDIGLLSRRFVMLDRQYPGSRFVFTVRPVEEWIDSRRRHVEHNIARKAAGDYDGTFLVVDEEKWRREWDWQQERVHGYFAGRDDFLEIDFTHGSGWSPLCALLDVPEPSTPFPWANRDRRVGASPLGRTRPSR
jgi:Sulfotransferase domain